LDSFEKEMAEAIDINSYSVIFSVLIVLTSFFPLFSSLSVDVVIKDEIPAELVDLATSKRTELLETLAEVDDQFGEIILNDETPTTEQIVDTIRRATIGLRFSPVFLGSAIKNTGVQTLLDGVCAYLPDPSESRVEAHDQNLLAQIKKEELGAKKRAEEEGEGGEAATSASAEGQEEGKKQEKLGMVELVPAADAPLVALAFKLEEGRFGQLTYMRVYQGEPRLCLTFFLPLAYPLLLKQARSAKACKSTTPVPPNASKFLAWCVCTLMRWRTLRVLGLVRSALYLVWSVVVVIRSATGQ
jgi:hypothetical protein